MKMIFNLTKREINGTIEKIKANEKAESEKDKGKALQQQQEDIEGKYYLQLLEERCKNERLQERIDQLEAKEKRVKESELESKKIQIQLHQVIVGVVDFIDGWHKDRTEELKFFLEKNTQLTRIASELKTDPVNPALIEEKK
jgi:hypothetical protein